MIKLIRGDITTANVVAIVNAANNSLLGGGGVDGAIHKAAGIELYAECKKLNGCKTGEAKITNGYKLTAKFVIHTVGPIWTGGNNNEEQLLENCYFNCFKIAKELNIKSIAFPSISTGVYDFPLMKATKIAINTIKQEQDNIEVYIYAFDENTFKEYSKLI